MPEPLYRDHPIRSAVIRRHFDADDKDYVDPPRRPRRGRVASTATAPVAPPAPSVPAADPAPSMVLSELVDTALEFVNAGHPGETPIVALDATGEQIPLIALAVQPPQE